MTPVEDVDGGPTRNWKEREASVVSSRAPPRSLPAFLPRPNSSTLPCPPCSIPSVAPPPPSWPITSIPIQTFTTSRPLTTATPTHASISLPFKIARLALSIRHRPTRISRPCFPSFRLYGGAAADAGGATAGAGAGMDVEEGARAGRRVGSIVAVALEAVERGRKRRS